MNAVVAALHMIVYYSVALGIWGLAFKKGFLQFGLFGSLLGLLISLVFIVPIIALSRSEDHTKEMMFAIGATWGNLGILVGILGVIVWIVRAVFF